jgi:hypothetical protein
VILFAEPPLHAEIKMRSSIMLSLILLLPDCTTKTSFSRILVKILTLVSPCDIGQPHHGTGRLHRIYIRELRKLDSSWGHAQIRAYLIRERRARAACEDECIAHCEVGVLLGWWEKA